MLKEYLKFFTSQSAEHSLLSWVSFSWGVCMRACVYVFNKLVQSCSASQDIVLWWLGLVCSHLLSWSCKTGWTSRTGWASERSSVGHCAGGAQTWDTSYSLLLSHLLWKLGLWMIWDSLPKESMLSSCDSVCVVLGDGDKLGWRDKVWSRVLVLGRNCWPCRRPRLSRTRCEVEE